MCPTGCCPTCAQSFGQKKVQATPGNTLGCKPTLTCALNSRRVVFSTAGMVANQHMPLLGAAPARPQTRFAFSFVDEASKHNIPVGLNLAATQWLCTTSTLQFMACQYPGTTVPDEHATGYNHACLLHRGGGGGGFGYCHSSLHPLPDPVLHNPIRIVDLDGEKWWHQPEESLGNADLRKMHSYVVEAWHSMRMDNVLAGGGNMSMEEGQLVCHFLELAVRARSYPEWSVAIVTTHYAQMVWLKWCVRYVGRNMSNTMTPILLAIATLDGFQGLQAQVILACLVSPTLGIMNDIWRANTLTSWAQSELHLFRRLAAWAQHPTPGTWIAALNAVQWEAGSATVGTTLELARVLREARVIDRVREGTIYRLGCVCGGALIVEALEEGQEGT